MFALNRIDGCQWLFNDYTCVNAGGNIVKRIFLQSLSLIIPVCVLMCVVRWSERLNSRRHIRHWKGFWPGNTLTCLFIFSCNFYWIVGNHSKIFIKYSYPGIFLITCVYPYVSRQFVTPRESSVALIDWTSVRSLVYLNHSFYILFVFELLVVDSNICK